MAANAFHSMLQCGAQNTDTIVFCKDFGLSTALCRDRGSNQKKPKLHISHKKWGLQGLVVCLLVVVSWGFFVCVWFC